METQGCMQIRVRFTVISCESSGVAIQFRITKIERIEIFKDPWNKLITKNMASK